VANVGDRVSRERVRRNPHEFAALLRLRVLELAMPAFAGQEEVHPLLLTLLASMHDVRESKVFERDIDVELFTEFPPDACETDSAPSKCPAGTLSMPSS
jgi:hypothetical protein